SNVGTGSAQNTSAIAPAIAYSSITPSAFIVLSERSVSTNGMVTTILRPVSRAGSPFPGLDSGAMSEASRRSFLGATASSAAALALPRLAFAQDALAGIRAEVTKRHAEGVERLQAWVKQPSIAAEGRGMEEGCTLMMKLAREAGFQAV